MKKVRIYNLGIQVYQVEYPISGEMIPIGTVVTDTSVITDITAIMPYSKALDFVMQGLIG